MNIQPRIKEILTTNPLQSRIPNEGVANVNQNETIQDELRNFVCEGQYAVGLERILNSYLEHLDASEQPAVWVSGFFGSGKSHFVKMLTYLWEDNTLGNGASARSLARLPADVVDALKELSTRGKQLGGLKAAAGVLDKALPAELGLLAILFQSAGFSQQYHIARLQMYLRDRGVLEAVRQAVEKSGKSLDYHLQAMYVSDVLGQAIVDALPGFAADEAEARQLLKAQYPKVKEITQQEMLDAISDLLAVDGRLPCTLIVLDELQQHIGVSADRSLSVQLVVEACCKQFSGRLLFVATGQSALSETTNLQKLMGRFRLNVELSDADVETVIRKLLLAKKPDQLPVVQKFLETHSGEIDRQLRDSRIGPRPEDLAILASDYPILPVRQRFWERVLRAIDKPGTAAQLRTQLRMVHEALSSVADRPLGAVVPADFLFDQQYSQMKQAGLLLKDIEGTIQKYRDESGQLKYKLCALAFLIGLLPRDTGADIGIRATPEMLSDLLVDDLADGGTELRRQVPELLEELAEAGDLMQIGDEYRLQTRESASWEQEFRNLRAKFLNDGNFIAGERSQLLRGRVGETLNRVQVLQGKSKVVRKLTVTYGGTTPTGNMDDIPVWVRNGWDDKEASVKVDAQQLGTSSPIITIYLPQRDSDDLRRAIAEWRAAEQVLEQRGTPTTDEGVAARSAMQTRMDHAQGEAKMLAGNVISHAIVLQGGGSDVTEDTLQASVETAAKGAMVRLFSQFDVADDPNWTKVVDRAKKGDGRCLDAVGWSGGVMEHPVCKLMSAFLSTKKKGSEARGEFEKAPYGWSRDATSGALLAMVVDGAVAATQSGMPVDHTALDQTKIAVAEFRLVTVQFPTPMRLALRALLTAAGISCKPNEEIQAIPALLDKLEALASEAGGEPPQPARPNTVHLADFRHLTGNELGVAVAQAKDRLTAELGDWEATGDKIKKRLPAWERLERLLRQAGELSLLKDIKAQVEAIAGQRSLIGEPDPVAPLLGELADALRNALATKWEEYSQEHDTAWQDLQGAEAWQKITEEQRQGITAHHRLAKLPRPDVTTDDALAVALEQTPLAVWVMNIAVLPVNFSAARLAAEKLLEPKLVPLKWPQRKITSEADLDKYFEDVRGLVKPYLDAGENVLL